MEMFFWLMLFYIVGSFTGYYLMRLYTIGSTIMDLVELGYINHRKDENGNLVILKKDGRE